MAGNVCPHCGAQLEPGATVCKECGTKIEQASPRAQPSAQPGYYSAPQQQWQYPPPNQSVNIGQMPPQGQPQQWQQQAYGQPQQWQQPAYGQPTVIIQNSVNNAQPSYVTGINPSWPLKSKVVAAVLAILLGGLGIHRFYLGETGMGILYLIFCWTGIPMIAGIIEGIVYLCSNDENFQLKHHVRLQ